MKKFLALVLALVMTMSLVTISAGAEFTDADEVTYDEAVEVMTALGIVTGDTTGAFNPTNGLTRGAAAKIICNMTLGVDVASALVAAEAPFSDVSVDNVFAGYIAYCAQEGIVSGYADGTFQPAAPLTGYAFLKMLLGALGYDADVEGLVGTNWGINVAKLAKQRGLTEGNDDYVGSKAITREEAMLYAFNTMLSETVVYDGASNSTITIGDVVIKNNGKAVYDTKPLFYTQSFSKLCMKDGSFAAGDNGLADITATGSDDFGRTAYTWYLNEDKVDGYNSKKDTKIGDYASAADYTVVVTGTKLDTLKEIAEDLDIDLNDKSGSYNKGDVVEIFVDEGKIIDTVVLSTKLAKVSKVVATTDKDADFEYTVSLKVGNTMKSYKDTDLDGFDADTMVKDTYVLYTAGTKTAIVAIPEAVTGSQTAYGTGYVKIDDTKVEKSAYFWAVDALNNTDTFDVYVDANGYAVGSVLVEEEEAEVQIFYVKEFQTKVATSFDAQKAQAAVVYLDGSEAVLNINVYKVNDVKNIKVNGADLPFGNNCITAAGYYAYTLNDAGEIKTLKAIDTTGTRVEDWKVLPATKSVTFAEKSAKVLFDTTALYATEDTVVVTLKDEKATTVTGYKNFEDKAYAQDTNAVLYNVDGKTLLSVYVVGAEAMKATDDTVYGWYVETGDTYEKDGSDVTDVYYNVEGVDTKYTINGTSVSDDYKALVSISVTDGIASLTKEDTYANVGLTKVTNKYVLVGASETPVYFADEVAFYDVTDVEENGVVALDEIVANSVVTYVVNTESPAEITAVYVTAAAQDDGVIELDATSAADKAYVSEVLNLNAAALVEGAVVVQYTRPDEYTTAQFKFWGEKDVNATVVTLDLTAGYAGVDGRGVILTASVASDADTYNYQVIFDGVVTQAGTFELEYNA